MENKPMAALPRYKKFMQHFETTELMKSGTHFGESSSCFLEPAIVTPPSPPPSLPSPVAQLTNPLVQLADITLAMQTMKNPALYQSLMSTDFLALTKLVWPNLFKQNRADMAALLEQRVCVSPPESSASPSPPPAHNSPIKTHTMVMDKSNNNTMLFAPIQTAPEDLSIRRKLELKDDPEDATSSSEAADIPSGSFTITNKLKIKKDGFHPCPECGKAYSTSSNLARHRQTHRSLEDKKARKCPHCDKTYVSMPAYSMHIRTHNLGCKCPFCGKCFSRPWLLQGHIRTHTGEKPFKCNICEKAFADKSNLRAHTQTHSNTKPYECQRCGKAFALKSYLYKHEESSCMRGIKQDRRKNRSLQFNLTIE